MKANYFCFIRNNNFYAIDTVRLIPLQLSQDAYYLLNEMNCTQNCDVDFSGFLNKKGFSQIDALAHQNILFHNEEYIVENSFRELSISLIPTLACNLNCKYCYSDRKKEHASMPIKMIYDVIKFFCDNFSFSFCRVDFVSGGEPLYDTKALANMIDTLSKCLNSYNKVPLFWLCTNGLLLTNEVLQYLDSKHCNLGISIDGPEDINDANRIDLKGNGTYKKVIGKLSEIQGNNALSRNIKNLWNCAVITQYTHSLVDVMKNSFQLGFKNLQMKIVWSADDSLRLSEDNAIKLYNELTKYLFSLIEENKFEEFLSICNENDTYGKVLLRIIIQSGVTRRCNAGINKFSISPEGKIYPCDSFLGIESYCIGDIDNGLNQMYYEFNRIRNDSIEKCKSCWIKHICGGDCFYHAYLNSGNPWTPDDKVCFIMKEITQMCIELIVSLYRAFPQKMQKIYAILSKKAIRMEPRA